VGTTAHAQHPHPHCARARPTPDTPDGPSPTPAAPHPSWCALPPLTPTPALYIRLHTRFFFLVVTFDRPRPQLYIWPHAPPQTAVDYPGWDPIYPGQLPLGLGGPGGHCRVTHTHIWTICWFHFAWDFTHGSYRLLYTLHTHAHVGLSVAFPHPAPCPPAPGTQFPTFAHPSANPPPPWDSWVAKTKRQFWDPNIWLTLRDSHHPTPQTTGLDGRGQTQDKRGLQRPPRFPTGQTPVTGWLHTQDIAPGAHCPHPSWFPHSLWCRFTFTHTTHAHTHTHTAHIHLPHACTCLPRLTLGLRLLATHTRTHTHALHTVTHILHTHHAFVPSRAHTHTGQ